MSKSSSVGIQHVSVMALAASLAACGGGGGGGGGFGPAIPGASLVANEAIPEANDFRGLTFGPNDTIFASGHTDGDGLNRNTVVAKFNALDGKLDTSFGLGGIVELDLSDPGDDEGSLGVVALSNGDVVVAATVTDPGGVGQSVQLVRLNSVGQRVSSFGTDGVAEVVFGWANADNAQWPTTPEPETPAPEDIAFDLKLDSQEERLVVFGNGSARRVSVGTQRTDQDRYVARIDAETGAADPAFNGGVAFTHNAGGDLNDNGKRGLVLDDNSILSSGYTNLGGDDRHHVILIKLTDDGVLDESFVGFNTATGGAVENGVAVFNPFIDDGGYSECYGVAQQADRSFVTTGYGGATGPGITSMLDYQTTQAQDVVSFRVPLLGGAIDTTWGNSGTQAIQSEADTGTASFEDRGRHLIALSDDRTVHVGRYGGDAALFVFTADGQLDTSVGNGGIIIIAPPANGTEIQSQFYAVAQDGDRVAVTTNNDIDGARLVVVDF